MNSEETITWTTTTIKRAKLTPTSKAYSSNEQESGETITRIRRLKA